MLADGYQNFAGHVTALLCTRRLVFNVDTCSSALYHEFRQLHDSRKTSMARIRVSDERSKEIGVGKLVAFGSRRAESLLALLAVVEKLCHEEVLHFVRNGSLRTVSNLNCA